VQLDYDVRILWKGSERGDLAHALTHHEGTKVTKEAVDLDCSPNYIVRKTAGSAFVFFLNIVPSW